MFRDSRHPKLGRHDADALYTTFLRSSVVCTSRLIQQARISLGTSLESPQPEPDSERQRLGSKQLVHRVSNQPHDMKIVPDSSVTL